MSESFGSFFGPREWERNPGWLEPNEGHTFISVTNKDASGSLEMKPWVS